MRVLGSAAIGWMAGILLQGSLAPPPVASALGVVAAVALFLVVRRGFWMAAVGLGALSAAGERGPPEPPPAIRVFAGEVARPVEPLPTGRRVEIALDGGARVLAYDGGGPELLPGDRVRFSGVAQIPRGYWDEGAFDRERLFAARGIDWEVNALRPGVVPTDEPPSWGLWRAAGLLRERAAAGLAAASDGDGGALLAALVLGRRGGVSDQLNDDFRRAGVAHVLSVSGLHLAAAAALFFALARRAWLRLPRLAARFAADRAAALVALPAAAAYTLVTGAEVATVRSLFCAAVVLGAKILSRPADALTALAVAALVILAASPLALYDASFQLSFAAAGALAVVARRLPRNRVLALIGASAAATLATAPLTALHFDVVQPAGLFTNLVVVPLAEMVVLPLGLVAAAVSIVSPVVAAPFTALAGWAAAALAGLVGLCARVAPSIDVPPPTAAELLVLGLGVVAALVWPWRRGVLALLTAASVCFAVEAWLAVGAPARRDGAIVTFLDVGQGDAAVIEAPHGETWLVDAGGRLFESTMGNDPGEQATLRFLVARRIRRLDLVVVSHPHPDHYGGLVAVAAHLPIAELWISGDDPGDARWTALLADLAARGTRVVRAAPGTTRISRAARLEILGGAPDPDRSVNDNSLVARLTVGGRRVLFAGDLEAPGEAALVTSAQTDVGADVVKVAHHGSKTSSSPVFVAATHPALAVVSCGAHNHFGFPNRAVISAWTAAGAAVVRTDRQGAVTVTLGPDGSLGWRTWR